MPSLLTQHYRSQLASAFLGQLQQWEVFQEGTPLVLYLFVGRPQAWAVEAAPPDVSDIPQDVTYDFWRDMLGAKRCGVSNINFIITRTNWATGTLYTQYDDTANTTPSVVLDANNYAVYSCLWNASGANSTVNPSGHSQGVDFVCSGGADGYVWKYLYTLPSGASDPYLTTNWLPIYAESDVITYATDNPGSLPVEVPLVVEVAGGYDPDANVVATVVGDGSGATIANASIIVTGNDVTAVSLSAGGLNYTEVTSINVYQAGASSATVRALIPPYPNHGYDLVSELNAKHLMINVLLDNREGDDLTLGNEFRRLGLVINPVEANTTNIANTTTLANNDYYQQTYNLTLSSNVGTFTADLQVYNANTSYGANLAVAPSGTVVDVIQDAAGNNVLRLTAVNPAGHETPFIVGEHIQDVATDTIQGTIASIAIPELLPHRGKIVFATHHTPVTRTANNFEEIKVVIPFGG